MKGSRFSDDVENSSLKSTEKFLSDCSESQTIKNSSSYVSEEEFLISTLKSYYHNLALKKNIKIAEKEYNLFGKINRVRRIFEFFDYKVVRLDRVYYAGLTKKNLPRGNWRLLDEQEINLLKMISSKPWYDMNPISIYIVEDELLISASLKSQLQQ